MADKIFMLALSPTMEIGTIALWDKKEGDTIKSGDVLCEVETDKATMDYESNVEGILLKIVAGVGARVKVGELIAIAGKPGEEISGIIEQSAVAKLSQPGVAKPSQSAVAKPSEPAIVKSSEPDVAKSSEPNVPVQEQTQIVSGTEKPQSRMIKASPLAREIARRKGIDLSLVTGSGPDGRIVKDDVDSFTVAVSGVPENLVGAGEVNVAVTKVPLSEKRRVIAKRLSDSMFTAPHFYMTVAVGVDSILAARKALNARAKSKVSLNAFIIKIVAEALQKHPAMLARWGGDSIIQYRASDIALAVAQKDGLITPVVRNCSLKGIQAIDEELTGLIDRARNNKLLPQEYTGATFTISNLGSYGIRQFTAIINPPESAILAVGEIFREMVIDDDDNEHVRSTMLLTLSCDHRIIDGAVAAEFARDLKHFIEDPVSVLY